MSYSDEIQAEEKQFQSYKDRRLVSEATETKGAVHNVYDDNGKYVGTTIGPRLGSTREERIERFKEHVRNKKKNKGGGLMEGIKRAAGGYADFVTGGMWDFDKRNRKGSPKDWGMRRMAGGLTDWATMGLTDFDKRGRGNLQFDPISGGVKIRHGVLLMSKQRGVRSNLEWELNVVLVEH